MSVVPLHKHKRAEDPAVIKAVRKEYCEYCGARAFGEPHHIKPRSLGGDDIRENLIQLCAKHHDQADELKTLSHHVLIPIVARREGLKLSQVYQAVGFLEPQEEPEEKLEEKIQDYLSGPQKACIVVDAEKPLDELVQNLASLVEAEEETRWLQGEIVHHLVGRGVKKGWIASQVGKSATYINALLVTYRAFPDEGSRVPELKWTHHKIAATKGKSDPQAWVARAADEQMSTRQMERAIVMEEGENEEKAGIVKQEEKELRRARKVFAEVEAVLERGGPAGEWLKIELKNLVC